MSMKFINTTSFNSKIGREFCDVTGEVFVFVCLLFFVHCFLFNFLVLL